MDRLVGVASTSVLQPSACNALDLRWLPKQSSVAVLNIELQ
jgi:hypothetical protein